MEALPPNVAHTARRAAEAQLSPASSQSQGTRWDSPDMHVHNPWISIPITVSQVHCFIPLCWKEMTSHGFYWWLHAKVMIFLPANKTGLSHSILLPICSTLRVELLKSASNYHQLPEEWPFSLFASLYHKIEQTFVCFCLQSMSPKYLHICYESEVLF